MRKKSIFPTFLMFFIVALLGAGGYAFFKDLDGPLVEVAPKNGRVSANTDITLQMQDPSGIRSVTVGIRRNNVLSVIYSKHYDEHLPQREAAFSLKDSKLREGAFDLEIRATDASLAGFGQGNTRTVQIPMRLDSQPPRISVKTLPPNIRRGGAAVIRYVADEELRSSGVLIAGYFVPGYLQKDGSHICFFPFPYSMTASQFKNALEITATDLAGNVSKNRLSVSALERNFTSDKITLTDKFLLSVQQKLHNLAPQGLDPLSCYLYINKDVRAANVRQLFEISKDTASAMLWSGTFARLPRSASRAGYGDHRFFYYQDKLVGEAYHLGFDLASVRHAPIPAANSGRVVFTGEVGIYGNLVVIDHGLGLMSLYSHLNDIIVKSGELVSKGQTIGHTGTTGLAFGDHLHLGILVGGMEVTPLEWIDAKWIRDNITGRLKASGF